MFVCWHGLALLLFIEMVCFIQFILSSNLVDVAHLRLVVLEFCVSIFLLLRFCRGRLLSFFIMLVVVAAVMFGLVSKASFLIHPHKQANKQTDISEMQLTFKCESFEHHSGVFLSFFCSFVLFPLLLCFANILYCCSLFIVFDI